MCEMACEGLRLVGWAIQKHCPQSTLSGCGLDGHAAVHLWLCGFQPQLKAPPAACALLHNHPHLGRNCLLWLKDYLVPESWHKVVKCLSSLVLASCPHSALTHLAIALASNGVNDPTVQSGFWTGKSEKVRMLHIQSADIHTARDVNNGYFPAAHAPSLLLLASPLANTASTSTHCHQTPPLHALCFKRSTKQTDPQLLNGCSLLLREHRRHPEQSRGCRPEGLAGVCHAPKLGHQLQGISERTLLAGRDGQVIGEGFIASELAQALQPQLQCAFQAAARLATILEHLARWLCFWQTLHLHTHRDTLPAKDIQGKNDVYEPPVKFVTAMSCACKPKSTLPYRSYLLCTACLLSVTLPLSDLHKDPSVVCLRLFLY